MNQGTVFTKIQNHVASIAFFHPASNAMPNSLLEKLANAFDSLNKNNDVRIIVLKSEKERAFCAGASFDELQRITTPEEGKKFFMGFANVLNAMRTCSKPIVGRIQGKTVGGGVGLAAACDYCFATEQAAIKLSELTIGIGPFVIAPAVKRKIGTAAFSELCLDATHWQNAYWAKEKGLFSKVFESISEMDKALASFTEKIATYNPEAVQEMKTIFWEGTSDWETLLEERAEIVGKLVLSSFTKETLSKYKKN